MRPDTRMLLSRLGALLRVADRSGAFAAALEALREVGIEPASRAAAPDGTAWLTLDARADGLVLRHSGATAPESGLDALVRPLLEAILERAAVDEALRKERERSQMLSSASFEGVFVHVDGTILDCNERCTEMLRSTREDFIAPGTIQRVVVPEDLPTVMGHMQSGSEEPYVITAMRADGTRFRAEIRAKQGLLGERPIRVAAVRDVTEREHRMALLRESEARLRALAEAMFDCFVESVEGRIIDVGGDFERITGHSRDELVGRMVLDFVAPAVRGTARRVIETGSTLPYDTLILRKDGTVIPVEIIGTPVTYRGEPARFAGLRDRSEARRVERERHELQVRVERGQRMEALGVLAGGIAHDFNNLLLGVLGHAELLEITLAGAGNTAQSLAAIKTAAGRAADLTRLLLAYAGRGRGPRWEPLDLGTVLQELQVLLSPGLSRDTHLRMHLQEGCVVRGDPTTLRQVLLNLLTNALDALPEGKGDIDVRVRHVTDPEVDWEDAQGAQVGPGHWVCIEVCDTGIGMDAQAQTRIFEPFYTTKAKGHGLGLAACLGILRAHRGAIRVQSDPGEGTRFSVLLPADGSPVVAEDEGAGEGQVVVTPCSVLVIDDEVGVRDQVMRLLSLRGFTVQGAADGEEGLRAFAEQQPELVILDVAMPGMDGIEVARRLRRAGATVPILLSSGYLDEEAASELDDELVQGLLPKPYSLSDLLQAIAAVRSVEPGAAAEIGS